MNREGIARFGASALAADYTFYLIYTSVPLKAISLGGGPLILGLLPALSSVVYIGSALGSGRLARPGRRMRMARAGALLLIAGTLLIRSASQVGQLFLFLPLIPIGGALFWPAIQAELGERGGASDLGRRIGVFNVCWSSGKMLGFLTAGHLAERFGPGAPLGLAAISAALLVWIPPGDRAGAGRASPVDESAEPDPPGIRRRYRAVAWASNLVAYGVMATLVYQFPKKVLSLGVGEGTLGSFLGLVQLVQTLTFLLHARMGRWERHRSALILPLLLAGASVAPLSLWRGEGWIFACAPGIGIALGFAYSASLYHSLHREADSGRYTGIHEAVLGSGGFLLPLAGGALASATTLNAPYLLCSAAFVGATVFALARLSTGGGPQRSSGSHQLLG